MFPDKKVGLQSSPTEPVQHQWRSAPATAFQEEAIEETKTQACSAAPTQQQQNCDTGIHLSQLFILAAITDSQNVTVLVLVTLLLASLS